VLLSAGAAATVWAPGEPLALACAAVATAVTWFAVDKAMIAIDEALFHNEIRDELIQKLQEQRNQLREELRSHLERAASDYRSQTEPRIDKVFVPARDG
jgi:flagellar biosynthesis regulator FlaF